jgi:IclR family transcriptional regulator, pca regulon regulatory protein
MWPARRPDPGGRPALPAHPDRPRHVRTDGRLFALRPKVLELGYSYLSSLGPPEVALPHMEALVARVHESSSLCVLDGTEIAYVARVPTRRIMTVTITVGSRFPAYATSMGRVLLAGLPPAEVEAHIGGVELVPPTPKTITRPDRPSSLNERPLLTSTCATTSPGMTG